jgi:PAS domain S-box-containing protein
LPNTLPSLRRLLMTLAAYCVVPTVALALGTIGYQYYRERNAIEAAAIARARTAMVAVNERLHDVEQALLGLAKSPQLTPDTLAEFAQQALVVQRSEETANVALIDASGRQLMNTLVADGTALPVEARAGMLEALRRGRCTVHDLSHSPLQGRAMVGIGIPVQVGEQVAYVLSAEVEPAVLQEVLLRQKLPQSWTAAVFDGGGRMVARTHDHPRYLGSAADPALWQRISEVAEDSVPDVKLDVKPMVMAFSRSKDSNWSIAIGIPPHELVAPARHSLELLLAGAALGLALTLWLAWSTALRISGSIGALGAAVRRAGHVPSIELPPPLFQEAHQLGQAFLSATAELQDANAAVGRNEQRLRTVLDTATDAIVTADGAGTIVLFNRAAGLMFRIDPDSAIGTPLEAFLPAAARAGHRQAMQTFGISGAPSRMMRAGRVVQAQRTDGSLFSAEASISVAVENGRRLHTAILRDVSEREQHKHALVRSNLELQELAAVASHDLRSPLKSITGYLDLLATRHSEGLANVGLAIVARARKAAVHMGRMTQSLLAYTQLEDRSPTMVPVDCQAVLADALQLLHEDIREIGAQVLAGRLPTVNGDSGQLVQLFFNLIDNALKYRSDSPLIEVAALRRDGGWLFSVSDNGIGIAPQYLDRIFDTFKRVHSQREYPGKGIGLALCRRVIESHGGTIWATSEPGRGSTFWFTLAGAEGGNPHN